MKLTDEQLRASKAARDKKRYEDNKEAEIARSKKYYKENREARVVYLKKCREREGFSVYRAIFPSGIYIGSGATASRRKKHLNGHSRIAKTLNEKALSFEVLVIGTKEYVAETEVKLIDSVGLGNLLNKRSTA